MTGGKPDPYIINTKARLAVSSLGHSEVEKRETKWGYEQNQLGKQLSMLSPLYRKKADTTYLLVEREEIMREGDRETDRQTDQPTNQPRVVFQILALVLMETILNSWLWIPRYSLLT